VDDLVLDVLATLYITFAAIDAYVFYRLYRPARVKPHIDALTATMIVSGTITVGGIIGAVLGLSSIWRHLTGFALLPTPVTLILLVVALGAPSAGSVYMWRQLRKWSSASSKALFVHARATDHAPHLHRRATDAGSTATLEIPVPPLPDDHRPPL
jgi:hypothetical protein